MYDTLNNYRNEDWEVFVQEERNADEDYHRDMEPVTDTFTSEEDEETEDPNQKKYV